jgi:DNA polymerase-3 subunit delta
MLRPMPHLDFDALRRSVRKGDIRPAYYFHGDEDLLKDDALRDLLEVAIEPATRDFNVHRRRAADLTADEFSTLALTPPMLAARRAVVVTEVEVLQQRRTRAQALREAIVAYLEGASAQTVLVLVQSASTHEDRDARLDPEFARLAATVAFDPLPPDRLRRWIRHRAGREGLNLDEEGAALLHEAVGDDLAQIAAEIGKLRTAMGTRPAGVQDVAELVGVRRGETVHDFVDAVTARRFAHALDMIAYLLTAPGITGVRLVSSLATAITGLALARALLDRGGTRPVMDQLLGHLKASRPVGLRRYGEEAGRWIRDAAGWELPELDRALGELLRADRRLKGAALGGDAEIVADAVLAMAGAPQSA